MSRSRQEDTTTTAAKLVGAGLLVVALVAAAWWNVTTCARWGTRTETEIDCYHTGSGYSTCTSYPVERSYCAERKP